MVSVLLPVKGVHERTLMHWRSQVRASHGGRMEFIFCMESEEDPAYEAALDFRRECGESVVGQPFSKVSALSLYGGLAGYGSFVIAVSVDRRVCFHIVCFTVTT
jgi:hypothetical protein